MHHICQVPSEARKRTSALLEVKVQMLVSCPGVAGNQSWSSARAVSALTAEPALCSPNENTVRTVLRYILQYLSLRNTPTKSTPSSRYCGILLSSQTLRRPRLMRAWDVKKSLVNIVRLYIKKSLKNQKERKEKKLFVRISPKQHC